MAFLVLGGCVTPPAPDSLVDASLSEDRAEIEKLRAEVPPERRARNDDLQEILKLTLEVKEQPEKIRDEWQRRMRRERESFRQKQEKERKDFNAAEKEKREAFLASQAELRKKMKRRAPRREEVQQFYSRQDRDRKEYFAAEQDRRQKFNSEQRQASQDFSAKEQELDREFWQTYRNYQRRYAEQKIKEAAPAKATGN